MPMLCFDLATKPLAAGVLICAVKNGSGASGPESVRKPGVQKTLVWFMDSTKLSGNRWS